jgi:hypothetical protein
MTRKQKIEFLIGIKNGTRKLSELFTEAGPGVMIFIQRDKNLFLGNDGKTYTENEISSLPGMKTIIKNPHVNDRVLEDGFKIIDHIATNIRE